VGHLKSICLTNVRKIGRYTWSYFLEFLHVHIQNRTSQNQQPGDSIGVCIIHLKSLTDVVAQSNLW